jgi:hypothetical protein
MDKKTATVFLHHRLHEGFMAWSLDLFSYSLNEKNKWSFTNPREAIWFYLVKKNNWTIDYCRSLKDDDLRFVLTEEMDGWAIPKEFRGVADPLHKALSAFPEA